MFHDTTGEVAGTEDDSKSSARHYECEDEGDCGTVAVQYCL